MNIRTLLTLVAGLLAAVNANAAANITITSQPQGIVVGQSQALPFSVQATSPTLPISYRWVRLDGAALPAGSTGGNSNVVFVNTVTSNAVGVYYCILTNSSGAVTSAPAGLIQVQTAPSFSVPTVTYSPTNRVVGQGSTVFLTVAGFGSGPIKLQWRGKTNIVTSPTFENIPGATNATLVLSNIQDSAAYLLRLDNANGAVGSAIANITVLRAPTIVSNPVSRAVVIGTNAVFSAVIDGGQLSYRWLKNGADLPPVFNGTNFIFQTNSTLTVAVTNVSNGGGYSIIGSNAFGSVTSAVAQLTVILPPTLVKGPASVSVPASGSATFSANADANTPLTMEWFINGNLVQSSTGVGLSQLVLPSLVSEGGLIAGLSTNVPATVTFRASNAAGTVTAATTILVTSGPVAPSIALQPAGTNLLAGGILSLAGLGSGTTPLYYQWNFNGTNIVGETNPVLNVLSMSASQAGLYNVVVTNAYGATSSVFAAVSVSAVTNRQIRIPGITPASGSSLLTPVLLRGLGGESTVDFTLGYRGFFINGVTVTIPPGSAATNVIRDVSAANSGILGLRVELDTNITAVAGERPLVNITFNSSSIVPSYLMNLAFTNSPRALTLFAGTNVLATDWVIVPYAPPAIVGSNVLAQSGLYQQGVEVYNPSATAVSSARVYASGLTNDTKGNPIRLYNATGSEGGVPFIEFGPLGASSSTLLTLEYYVSDRVTVPNPIITVVFGSGTLPAVTNFTALTVDRALFTNGVFLVEFLTSSNRAYYVQYTSDPGSTNWATSFPGLIGSGNRVQWIDNGPPRTASLPTNGTRFYRVITPQ